MYDGSTDCVVTWNQSQPGREALLSAYIGAADGRALSDGGYYKYYAGPVKLRAPGQCIRWGGSWGVGDLAYTSKWEHCG